jgi:hypothetical protein
LSPDNYYKALGVSRPASDLQHPSTPLLDPPHDGVIAAIGPDQLQATPPVVHAALDPGKEFLQNHFAARTIGHARTMHHYQQEHSQDIDHNMALTPINLIVDLRSSLFSPLGRLDALAINNGGTGLGLSPGLLPDRRDQRRVELLRQPAVAPAPIIPIDGLPGREVVGQQPPRLSTAHKIEDRIDDLAVRPGTRAAPRPCGQCQQRGKAAPLVIIEIGWVRTSGLGFHPPRLTALFTKRSLRDYRSVTNLKWRSRAKEPLRKGRFSCTALLA